MTMLSTRSRAARVDLSLRGPLYVMFAAVPLAAGARLGMALGNAALIAAGLAAAQALACVLLLHAAIDHRLGKGPRPDRRAVVAGGLTVATVVAGWPAYGRVEDLWTLVTAVLLAALLTALCPLLSGPVTLALTLVGWLVAAGPAILRDGTALGPHLGLFLLFVAAVLSCRGTLWTLDVVWELDGAQQVKADLAVAEERLRFARDLHDVAGRTLSVVALKAELAAQLGKRGRPEAVEEMLEVRRIAQESLAELRAVVNGLRTARLDEELAGARSLLAAAGIAGRVIGDGDRLGPRTQTALGWAVREATTNVLRHSEAGGCTIELARGADGSVRLVMTNDGAPGGPVRPGNGLTGLTERIAGAGGTVVAERLPPDRFRVSVYLPAEEAA